MNAKVKLWWKTLKIKGFRLSRCKTEYMECKFSQRRTPDNIEVSLSTHKILEKENFRYLGSMVQHDGGIDTDVSHKIQAGWTKWMSVSGVLCDRKVPLKVKEKYYKVVVRPALLYGSECWAVKHNHVRRWKLRR